MNRAFITGITGQDGSYLCELLLEKGYEVHGLVPVSYTHLDVYKRQGKRCARAAIESATSSAKPAEGRYR